LPDTLWSPWGIKSGPNYQFFHVLERSSELHSEPWILLIEPDTIPGHARIESQVANEITQNMESWFIGGFPHALVTATLQEDLWFHLNGAGLFHVGDKSFICFCSEVWIPSLLEMVSRNSRFAYDGLTATEIYKTLSPVLRKAWSRRQEKFVETKGIINLSTLHFSLSGLIEVLQEPDVAPAVVPWMIHAKGVKPEWTAALDSMAEHTYLR